MKKLALLSLALLLCGILCSCEESPKKTTSYQAGSGTALSSEESETSGLKNGGTLSDDQEWGPVIGLD